MLSSVFVAALALLSGASAGKLNECKFKGIIPIVRVKGAPLTLDLLASGKVEGSQKALTNIREAEVDGVDREIDFDVRQVGKGEYVFVKLGSESILVDCKVVKKFKKKIGRDAFGNKCILKTPAVLKDKCKTVKVRSFKKITADNGNVFTTTTTNAALNGKSLGKGAGSVVTKIKGEDLEGEFSVKLADEVVFKKEVERCIKKLGKPKKKCQQIVLKNSAKIFADIGIDADKADAFFRSVVAADEKNATSKFVLRVFAKEDN